MLLSEIFVPASGSHTVEDARRVMADSEKLSARRERPINARCAATKAPPAMSASDVYFSAVERHISEGMSVAQAKRTVAIQQRSLLDGYLREHTAQASNRAERKRQEAARARTARNSH